MDAMKKDMKVVRKVLLRSGEGGERHILWKTYDGKQYFMESYGCIVAAYSPEYDLVHTMLRGLDFVNEPTNIAVIQGEDEVLSGLAPVDFGDAGLVSVLDAIERLFLTLKPDCLRFVDSSSVVWSGEAKLHVKYVLFPFYDLGRSLEGELMLPGVDKDAVLTCRSAVDGKFLFGAVWKEQPGLVSQRRHAEDLIAKAFPIT